jgi:hypothetical protein
MTTQYIEICSSSRNRHLFPNPAQFEVNIAQSGTKTKTNALDPVSNMAPLIQWLPNNISGITTVNTLVLANGENTTTKILVLFAQPTDRILDYYAGLPITVEGAQTSILSSLYVSTLTNGTGTYDIYWLTLNYPLPTQPAGGETVAVDSTQFSPATDGVVWIPNSFFADNYYTGYYLCNDNQHTSTPILSYDGATHMAGISTTFEVNTGNLVSIRVSPVTTFGVVSTTPSPTSAPVGYNAYAPTPSNGLYIQDITSNSIQLSTQAGYYVGDILNIPQAVLTGTFQTPSGSITGTVVFNSLTYRITYFSGSGMLVSTHTSSTPSTPPDLVVLTPINDCTTALYGGVYMLIKTPPASYILSTTAYEILTFTRDNVVPFTYTGSTVSQQEMTCYEIQLLDLILPNVTLTSGGRVAFYPYLYVEFQNVSDSGSSLSNIIYSNNPNATKKLFRCTVNDVQNPLISQFVKIDGDGMKVTIKFKPYDNLKFAVYLIDGSIFKTVDDDFQSPAMCNQVLQISALFAIKKI